MYDTTVNGFTFKIWEDQELAGDFSSNIALTAWWRKNWLVTFNITKTKLVKFHNQDPEFSLVMMSSHMLKEAHCFEHLLRLNLTSELKLNSYIWSITKVTGKMVVPFPPKKVSDSSWFTSIKLDQKSTLEIPNPKFPALIEFKRIFTALWVMNHFLLYNPLLQRSNIRSPLLLYHYLHGKYSNELHSLLPPVQTFKAKTYHANPIFFKYLFS